MFKSKTNMKLFPIYKMFSWDLLFYYAISFLFLTQEKGFSASQVISADAFYIFFKMFVQIFCIMLLDKLGNKTCLITGNILVALSIYIVIISANFSHIIIAFFVMAFGYSFKDLCESPLLYSSIPQCSDKGKIFAKIDSKGASLWYFFDGITSIIASFSFVINAYFPMYFCIACLIISALICFNFEDDNVTEPNSQESNDEEYSVKGLKEYIQDTKYAFKFIFKSRRLRALLLFSIMFYSILNISSTLRSSLFVDLNVPAQYFGIFAAIYQIIASISSKKQDWFHNKFRNKTLAFFSMSMCLLFISAGIIGTINNSSSIVIILIIFSIHYIVKGPYYTLIDKYLNSFSSKDIRNKIFSARSLVISIFSTIILQIASLIIDHFTTAQSLIILGISFLIGFMFTLQYMKTRVGLKPEEYKKSDIEFITLK